MRRQGTLERRVFRQDEVVRFRDQDGLSLGQNRRQAGRWGEER